MSISERVASLELKMQSLEAARNAIEWLGQTIAGQTEALDIIVEELAVSVDKELPQKIASNHGRRQNARRQAAIQEAKNAMKQLVDNGILVETDSAVEGCMLVGVVTKDDKVVQEYESGLFQNFPDTLKEAIKGKGPGVTWDGPKGTFELQKIYTFKKADPKVVAKLVEQAAEKQELPPEVPQEPTEQSTDSTMEAPKAESDGNQQ